MNIHDVVREGEKLEMILLKNHIDTTVINDKDKTVLTTFVNQSKDKLQSTESLDLIQSNQAILLAQK